MTPVSLFTPEDIQRFADEASATDPRLKLKITSDEAFFRATQDLRMAFDWAIQCDQIEQQQSSQPERARQWHQRVAKRAKDLMEALDLTPSNFIDNTTRGYPIPTIDRFRYPIDYMAGLRPPLPPEIDRLTRLAWQESEAGDDGDDIDAAGKCQYRRRASFLVDRLPRTLALVVALAEHHNKLADQKPRRRGERPDELRRQLFMRLAAVHETIFGGRPRTRDTVGKPRLGSVKWARVLIEDASSKINATGSAAGAKYVAALRAIARQADSTLARLLEDGWKDSRPVRSSSTAR
jgi:hypothetical protein